MKALQIEKHGAPSDLRVAEVADPVVGRDEVRVEIRAAGVNPSDVVSAAGRFPGSPLPRILGRDFAGRVTEGPAEWIDADVWGSGGDLGIIRDGSHAEQIVLPATAVARRPSTLSDEQAAAAGVPFCTAWYALMEAGQLQDGAWVIVSGAAGAVGGAAVEIAASRRARVIALVRDDEQAERLDRGSISAVASSAQGDLVEVVRGVTSGRGADLALNGVGGAVAHALLESLADGGRMVTYSAIAGREIQLDLLDHYRRRLTLTGVNTAVLHATDCARILTALAPRFESGELRIRQKTETFPLSEAAAAYERVRVGTDTKLVLIP